MTRARRASGEGSARGPARGPDRGPHAAAGTRRRAAAARGVTLLETMLAGVMIAAVASGFAAAVSYSTAQVERQNDLLGAYELANRLILTYADDPRNLPDEGDELEYPVGGTRYRWEFSASAGVRVNLSEAAMEADAASTVQLGRRMTRLEISVWVAESSGGARELREAEAFGVPRATLVRLVDRLAVGNLDAAVRRGLTLVDALLETQLEAIDEELIEQAQAELDAADSGGSSSEGSSSGSGESGGSSGGGGEEEISLEEAFRRLGDLLNNL